MILTVLQVVTDMVTLCALGYKLWVRDAIIVFLSAEEESEWKKLPECILGYLAPTWWNQSYSGSHAQFTGTLGQLNSYVIKTLQWHNKAFLIYLHSVRLKWHITTNYDIAAGSCYCPAAKQQQWPYNAQIAQTSQFGCCCCWVFSQKWAST